MQKKKPNPVITRLSFTTAATFFPVRRHNWEESFLVHLHQVFLDIV